MPAHLLYGDEYWTAQDVPSPGDVSEGTWLHLNEGKGTPLWAVTYICNSVSWAPMQLWRNVPLDQVPKELRLKLLILGG